MGFPYNHIYKTYKAMSQEQITQFSIGKLPAHDLP